MKRVKITYHIWHISPQQMIRYILCFFLHCICFCLTSSSLGLAHRPFNLFSKLRVIDIWCSRSQNNLEKLLII